MRPYLFPASIAAALLIGCGAPGSSASNASESANEHGSLASEQAEARAAAERAMHSDPVAFVRATYRDYENGDDIPDASEHYSRSLRALIEADRREAGGEIGRLDFDPWINGQDWELEGAR